MTSTQTINSVLAVLVFDTTTAGYTGSCVPKQSVTIWHAAPCRVLPAPSRSRPWSSSRCTSSCWASPTLWPARSCQASSLPPPLGACWAAGLVTSEPPLPCSLPTAHLSLCILAGITSGISGSIATSNVVVSCNSTSAANHPDNQPYHQLECWHHCSQTTTVILIVSLLPSSLVFPAALL